MKRIILSLLLVTGISIGTTKAQSLFDGVRYSQNFYEGTARFTSMGGAFAALGGDFTSLSINPAGVGVYRSAELSFTPAISYSKTSSSYEDASNIKNSYTKFGVSNLGYVMPIFNSGSTRGLVNLNLAIGYNKLNNYNYRTSSEGRNIDADHSMVNSFVNQANQVGYYYGDLMPSGGYNPLYDNSGGQFSSADWPVLMAWQTNLLADVTDYTYRPYVTLNQQRQYNTTESSGSTGEYVLSFGGNVSHKLYFGATLGLQDVNYESASYYEEQVINPVDLNRWGYNQFYETYGVGINLKAGVIYRPVPELRLAFAAHTPTFFYLTDRYTSSQWSNITSTSFVEGGNFNIISPENYFDYRINTPYKLVGGIAYTLKQYGLISVDYELVDYSTLRMHDDEYANYRSSSYDSFNGENNTIRQTLRAASNVRAGLEVNIPGGFAVRAGYGYYQSPFKGSADRYLITTSQGKIAAPQYSMGVNQGDINVYSAGVGYRFGMGYVDFGYSLTKSKSSYLLDSYTYGVMDGATTKNSFNRFALTVGFKF